VIVKVKVYYVGYVIVIHNGTRSTKYHTNLWYSVIFVYLFREFVSFSLELLTLIQTISLRLRGVPGHLCGWTLEKKKKKKKKNVNTNFRFMVPCIIKLYIYICPT
jgi:hypothetical protein